MLYTNELCDWVRQNYPEIHISDWSYNGETYTSFSLQDPRRL